MRKIKLSDIRITEAYANTTPKDEKMNECRSKWNNYHRQDRYIVITPNNVLIDGYIQYLVLKENDVEEAEVKISTRRKKRWYRKNTYDWDLPHYKNELTTYVYGVHPNSKCAEEFIWRVPKSWTWFSENIQVGDKIYCNTKFGISPIIVKRIEVLDKCPVDFQVKRVARCKICRDGEIMYKPMKC